MLVFHAKNRFGHDISKLLKPHVMYYHRLKVCQDLFMVFYGFLFDARISKSIQCTRRGKRVMVCLLEIGVG